MHVFESSLSVCMSILRLLVIKKAISESVNVCNSLLMRGMISKIDSTANSRDTW